MPFTPVISVNTDCGFVRSRNSKELIGSVFQNGIAYQALPPLKFQGFKGHALKFYSRGGEPGDEACMSLLEGKFSYKPRSC